MRFLVDECTGPAVARWLHDQGHEVFSVFEQARGIDDDTIIRKAFVENWVLITSDKDFGEKVYRQEYEHRGVVLLRLKDERAENQIKIMQQLLAGHAQQLQDAFVVATEKNVRYARSRQYLKQVRHTHRGRALIEARGAREWDCAHSRYAAQHA